MFMDLTFHYTREQQEQLKNLRSLVEKCPTLDIGTEDVLLSKFLNYSGWQVERAYKAIENYYEFKFRHPDWVAQHTVQYYREALYFTLSKFVLPKPDKAGRVIVVLKTVDAFKKYPNYLHDTIEMEDLIFESLLLIPRAQKFGITVIYDLSGTTKNYLRLLSPSIAKVLNKKDEILPFNTRIVHLIQRGFLMNATSSLVMPFLSKEFKEKIFTHDGKNFEKLRDMVGYESLPNDYGGPIGNVLDVNLIYKHLLRNEEYLVQLQSYKKKAQ